MRNWPKPGARVRLNTTLTRRDGHQFAGGSNGILGGASVLKLAKSAGSGNPESPEDTFHVTVDGQDLIVERRHLDDVE